MNQMDNVVKVGIAEIKFVKAPKKIRTSGLGSCVGLVIFHPQLEIAGLAHIMLPDSSLSKTKTINKAKYADTAVKTLIENFQNIGLQTASLKAKMAGGAQMFSFQTTSNIMRIGQRNVESVKQQLKKYNIPLISEDVGGKSGRTIEFDPKTTSLLIRTVNNGVKNI
ncbi:chemotaxis protein CheD [Bacillus alveayuensis]|jgi:chemotaxis protein CheD|uniref:Probable chemoreceptor glutamine deamidase CheD n=1 Tax=Aeribacillus alveayuensis TaxID=279215 RepID=A0ABT9VLA9_9BACI|nr:chemotaxis protein CheD [Bacillus alveayuensis]MDQ0161759.1 chemotaxis protein CheD [Bacillus alveayuensis]